MEQHYRVSEVSKITGMYPTQLGRMFTSRKAKALRFTIKGGRDSVRIPASSVSEIIKYAPRRKDIEVSWRKPAEIKPEGESSVEEVCKILAISRPTLHRLHSVAGLPVRYYPRSGQQTEHPKRFALIPLDRLEEWIRDMTT